MVIYISPNLPAPKDFAWRCENKTWFLDSFLSLTILFVQISPGIGNNFGGHFGIVLVPCGQVFAKMGQALTKRFPSALSCQHHEPLPLPQIDVQNIWLRLSWVLPDWFLGTSSFSDLHALSIVCVWAKAGRIWSGLCRTSTLRDHSDSCSLWFTWLASTMPGWPVLTKVGAEPLKITARMSLEKPASFSAWMYYSFS